MEKLDNSLAELLDKSVRAIEFAVAEYGQASVDLVLKAVQIEAIVSLATWVAICSVLAIASVLLARFGKGRIAIDSLDDVGVFSCIVSVFMGFIAVLIFIGGFMSTSTWIAAFMPEAALVLRVIN